MVDNDSVDDAIRGALRRELQTHAPQRWDDTTAHEQFVHATIKKAPAFRLPIAHAAPSDSGRPYANPQTHSHRWWWVAVSTSFAVLMAVGLLHVMTGAVHHNLSTAGRSS